MPEPARPLLILDLDETLIYATEDPLLRAADFLLGPFHVYQRPHVMDFLAAVRQHFELAIWSSASADYVAGIAAELARHGVEWEFVWSRSRCVQRMDPELMETQFVKDLKKVKRLGYDLDRVLIVDDTHHKVARNYGNAIYVAPYEGDAEDRELPRLADYLDSLRTAPNFRKLEKRGWRNKRLRDRRQ